MKATPPDARRERVADRPATAVIGLGDLGLACALRLNQVGVPTLGIDSDEQRRALWRAETGLDGATSYQGLRFDRALVCVRTTAQARAVLAELRGHCACADLVAYVMTTLEPEFARGLSAHGGDGLRVVELPVSGGRAAARAGELTVLVGGGAARPEDVAFLERTLASRVFRFARLGDATLAKLLNNTLATYNAVAFATCLELAERAGASASTCGEVIRAASGSSWIAEHFEDVIDELLVKDAQLLAGELGALPAIELADSARPLKTLARGRALLR